MLVALIMQPCQAIADDERMAGEKKSRAPFSLFGNDNDGSDDTQSINEKLDLEESKSYNKDNDEQETETTAEHTNKKALTPPPYNLSDLAAIEKIGLRTSIDSRYNIKFWNGTTRDEAEQIYKALSKQTILYPTLTRFVRETLISEQKTSPLKDSLKKETENDLFTLRIETLTAMGFYDDAATLYKRLPKTALHNRMAKAGVRALLYNKEIAIACLETQLYKTFFADEFWAMSEQICNKILSQDIDNDVLKGKKNHYTKLIKWKKYVYTPKTLEDLQGLHDDERAWLFAMDRVNISRLLKKKDVLPPLYRALFVSSEKLNIKAKHTLLLSLIKQGYRQTSHLQSFYKTIDDNADQLEDEKNKNTQDLLKLATLYKTLEKSKTEDERKAVLKDVETIIKSHQAESILPFADLFIEFPMPLRKVDSIRKILRSLLHSDALITSFWINNSLLKNNDLSDKKDLTFVTLALNTKGVLTTETSGKLPDTALFFRSEEKKDEKSYEKLDIRSILHNYSAIEGYEKNSGLTVIENYVISTNDFLVAFDKSKQKDYDGKRILLNTIVLSTTPLGTLYPDEVQRMVDSFLAVGLRSKAQGLVQDIILNLE
jgi:hypothetical protein